MYYDYIWRHAPQRVGIRGENLLGFMSNQPIKPVDTQRQVTLISWVPCRDEWGHRLLYMRSQSPNRGKWIYLGKGGNIQLGRGWAILALTYARRLAMSEK